MSAPRLFALVVLAALVWAPVAVGQAPAPAPSAPTPLPGEPATPAVVSELKQALADATARFERMDLEGVLASVSDRYRTGPLTKPVLRQQLLAIFSAYDNVRARVRIDDVRMIGDRAWVYSTGEVTGRVRLLGTPMSLFSWEREPEVAWREGGRWRLIGDQQS